MTPDLDKNAYEKDNADAEFSDHDVQSILRLMQ